MKKNFNKIPKSIRLKLKKISSQFIVVGYARSFSAEFLKKGGMAHLGIVLTDKGLTFPQSIIPSAEQGKYSRKNRHGEEIVRKDLPTETHYRIMESPDWGDWSKGSHSVNIPFEKYPREFIAPILLSINIEAQKIEAGQESYIIKFELSEVLDRNGKNFEERLLAGLNILQENTGYIGIQAAGSTLEDYIKTLNVAWEILPPGTKEEVVVRLSRAKSLSIEERREIEDRYDFFTKLNPSKHIYGTSGFVRYFGAMLKDNLVIFENIEYGNAVYIMFEDWQTLSKRSRIELMSGKYGQNFERVPHIKNWKENVLGIIKERKA